MQFFYRVHFAINEKNWLKLDYKFFKLLFAAVAYDDDTFYIFSVYTGRV